MILPVVNAPFEKVLDSDILNAIHGVSFARTSLTVSEDGHDTLVEDKIEDGSDLEKVQLLVSVMLIEGVVELEFGVFDGFGDTIDLVAAVVNHNFWVYHADHINLTVSQLVLEDWSLLEAD